jgi:hypothetical protein
VQHRLDTRHTPGTIALASGTQPRYYEFTSSLDNLNVPAGTVFNSRRSCDVAYNFNRATRDMKGDWVWYLGDDHQFGPNTLMRLLDHDVDVVVPISPCKTVPFMPCVMHGPEDGSVWSDSMPLYEWSELSGEGLMELPKGDFIGQAGMLVKKHVLDAIGDPWFKTGQFDAGRLQEDLWFCHEMQELGFKVMVDRSMIFDHWFIVGVTARKHEGVYVPALKSGAAVLVLPDALPMRSADQNTGVGPGRVTWTPVPGMEKVVA